MTDTSSITSSMSAGLSKQTAAVGKAANAAQADEHGALCGSPNARSLKCGPKRGT